MALTFRFGPNSYCEPAVARERGYQPYTGPEPAKPAPRPATPKAAPPRSAMPRPPAVSKTPIVYMRADEMRAERAKLERWMVLVAAHDMNTSEQRSYDATKFLADQLYAFELMSR